jgi:hypothetical protein
MRAMGFSDVVARLPRKHGRPPVTDRPISHLPHSTVLVLDDEVELRAAVERAIAFERGVALRTAENISRYEELAGRGAIAEVRVGDSQIEGQIRFSEQSA